VDLALTRGVSWTIKSGASESALPEGRSWTQTIELPGATWVLIVVPEEGEIPVAGLPVWMVLGAGLLVTLLVTYLFLLVGQRTQAKSQMEEMERTAAEKDRFLASVSHELRTPLTVVTGLAHELKDNVGHFDAGELAELLDMLARQSDEVAAIVEDLLVAVRGNLRELPLSLGPVELASETRRVIDGCGMTVPVIGSPTHAWADAGRVRQIIRNLVVNADRYGGPEKQVRVGTENGGVWVEVADSGPPIPDDVQSRMFDPYVSASGKRSSGVSSMGLGLHISQRLAELLKGSLSYRHEGAFGLFTLRLPAAMKTAPASGSRGPAAEGAVPSASSSGGHPGGRRHSLENSPSR
jgi:two-component system sensor histidine kinase MtrB